MSILRLTEDTWLDLTVNLVPLGILAFFDVLFWIFNPWGWDPWFVFWAHVLTLVPFVLLTILTYVSGRAIQGAERHTESATEADDTAEA